MMAKIVTHNYSVRPKMKNERSNQNGFSLVELAVVLVLIGIVMTMGLGVATSTLENSAFQETKSKQERIRTSLIGFLRTNGRLPCPDNAAGVATGAEAIPCNTSASDGYGVLPWITLGLPREAAIDGWGNFFTYRVVNGVPNTTKNWTSRATGSFDINELRISTNALTIKELDAGGSTLATVSSTAVVVLLSHGKNGFGAKTTKLGPRLPTTDAGAGELTNATVSTAEFILRPVTESASASYGPYDDLVSFMTPQDLFQPLINEGSLKSCYAYCPTVPSCGTGGGSVSCSGTAYCSGTGVVCTTGVPSCTSGILQCAPPGTGCSASAVPVGTSTVFSCQ